MGEKFEISTVPGDQLTVDSSYKQKVNSEGYDLRWIAKNDPAKFRLKQSQGAIPCEDYPEHPDLKLHKIPKEVRAKRRREIQAESDSLVRDIWEKYDETHRELTGKPGKITSDSLRGQRFVGDAATENTKNRMRAGKSVAFPNNPLSKNKEA